MKRAVILAGLACGGLAAALLSGATQAAAAAPAGATVYDATTPLGGNIPSLGYEANGVSEFGDQITFAGSARTLNVVTVTMSSWACQHGSWNNGNCASTPGSTFRVPITLNIYAQSTTQDDGTVVPGDLLDRVTKTFAIPYRPSANVGKCNTSNGNLGKWYDKANTTCYNGKTANITFALGSAGIKLPDTVVVGISYNTSDYGPHPIGQQACSTTDAGCPYDSLNVGTNAAVSVGSKEYPGTAFQNTAYASTLCDKGAVAKANEFNLDSPGDSPDDMCWDGYVPAIKVTASGGSPTA